MFDVVDRDAWIRRAEEQVAELCGVLNATTASLVEQIAQVMDGGLWEGVGIRSPEHWVVLHCGVSPARARWLVGMARRLPELPDTKQSFGAGVLSEDQVKVVVRHAPTHNDAEVAEFARHCTVPQLRRTLSSYSFAEPAAPPGTPAEAVSPELARRVTFGFDEDGSWRLFARLPAEEGAVWEKALGVLREDLLRNRDTGPDQEVTWADAFMGVAEAVLGSPGTVRPRRERYLTLLHVETDAAGRTHGRVHQGPPVPDSLRRLLTCDGQIKPVHLVRGVAVSVGRAQRIVPQRTRVVVEDRDRGCRVPGCANRRWTDVHHIVHWEDGGATDTANLVLICGPHHRMHHRGRLGIAGDADDPDGLFFTDQCGRRMRTGPTPITPTDPPADAARRVGVPDSHWQHPSGEQLQSKWVWFTEPPTG